MTGYTHFIGIDIGKFTFVAHAYGSSDVKNYDNTEEGRGQFLADYEVQLADNSLCILETTGGYEMDLLLTLCHQSYAVHRANTRKVKNFIRSYGNKGKTDALDAKALALYGYERQNTLACYDPSSDRQFLLCELVARRHDLTKILVSEKNRLKAPRMRATKSSCEAMIKAAEEELEKLSNEIGRLIDEDKELKRKQMVLKTIPGIGEKISKDLVVLLPELGQLDRKKIASLVGLAPKANDSGKYRGYRSTGHGREGVKPMLFMAAMAARNSNSRLKVFYEQLIGRGKVKKVALTALMRKIIIIANARVKEIINNVECSPTQNLT